MMQNKMEQSSNGRHQEELKELAINQNEDCTKKEKTRVFLFIGLYET
jgi:hypothetical protein